MFLILVNIYCVDVNKLIIIIIITMLNKIVITLECLVSNQLRKYYLTLYNSHASTVLNQNNNITKLRIVLISPGRTKHVYNLR